MPRSRPRWTACSAASRSLDPDFADMRGDERFRELIKKMCEGTNDPNCVYGGAETSGRER